MDRIYELSLVMVMALAVEGLVSELEEELVVVEIIQEFATKEEEALMVLFTLNGDKLKQATNNWNKKSTNKLRILYLTLKLPKFWSYGILPRWGPSGLHNEKSIFP